MASALPTLHPVLAIILPKRKYNGPAKSATTHSIFVSLTPDGGNLFLKHKIYANLKGCYICAKTTIAADN
jgi:hypothetical protein